MSSERKYLKRAAKSRARQDKPYPKLHSGKHRLDPVIWKKKDWSYLPMRKRGITL